MANIEIPDEFIICTNCGEYYEIGELKENVCPKCGCTELLGENEYFAREVGFVEQPTSPNIPKCPTCGSTKVHPISAGKKAIGFAMVGIFSKNFGKSYECDDCKYKW